VREVLYDVERENIRQHGYGMNSFAIRWSNVSSSCRSSRSPRVARTIHRIAYNIAEHPIELLRNRGTSPISRSGHHLFLVTKGNITGRPQVSSAPACRNISPPSIAVADRRHATTPLSKKYAWCASRPG